MQTSGQPSLFGDLPPLTEQDEKKFAQAITDEIMDYLENAHQPGAGELLEHLEKQLGWKVRHLFLSIIRLMRNDHNIQVYLRSYLSTTLADEAIEEALRGSAKPNLEHRGIFEELMQQSTQYRKSAAFREMIEFVAKFRDYAPYNNMLVKVQNPSCSFYATARDWRYRFKREVREDARPMLILAPMCPVIPVYDLDSTVGPPLPDKLEQFAKTEGDLDRRLLYHTLENAERDKILVQFKILSSTHAGFATMRLRDGNYKMRIAIHDALDDRRRYAILCH